MAMEPITLFSRVAKPELVARKLRELVPDAQIDGSDSDWRQAVVTFGSGGSLSTLTLNHDPAYYSEPNWSQQMQGMRNYLSQFPDSERKAIAVILPTSFCFSLGTIFEPDFDPSDDPRLDVLYAISAELDGVLFTPSSLRDAQGRILFGAGGEEEEDPSAVWPKVIAEVAIAGGGVETEDKSDLTESSEQTSINAPSASRVARRAVALTAVTVRAIIEQDAKMQYRKSKKLHADLLEWLGDLHIDDELEPEEWEVLQRPPGRLDAKQQIIATWRLESLAVLAWALGRFQIPPHDQLVDMHRLWKSMCMWKKSSQKPSAFWSALQPLLKLFGIRNGEDPKQILANPTLRPREEILKLRKQLFALHWRLRNYDLRPEVIDFAEFARTCWFGPLDITGFPLVQGDLGIRGKRLDRVSRELRSEVNSIALERHLAVNWLYEGPDRYSEASTAT